MANIETTGIVHAIPAAVTRGSYVSRVIVIRDDSKPEYPTLLPFEFNEKNMGKLFSLRVGDTVKVTWEPRGREWTDPKNGEVRYFGSFAGWKADLVPGAARGGASTPPPEPTGPADPLGDIPFATCDMSAEPSPISRTLRRAV